MSPIWILYVNSCRADSRRSVFRSLLSSSVFLDFSSSFSWRLHIAIKTMLEAPPGSLPPAKMEALLNGPAGKPPVGLRPNLDNPATLDGTIIAVLMLCLVISTTSVLVRSYTKKYLIKSVALEDCKSCLWSTSAAYLTRPDIIVIAWVSLS